MLSLSKSCTALLLRVTIVAMKNSILDGIDDLAVKKYSSLKVTVNVVLQAIPNELFSLSDRPGLFFMLFQLAFCKNMAAPPKEDLLAELRTSLSRRLFISGNWWRKRPAVLADSNNDSELVSAIEQLKSLPSLCWTSEAVRVSPANTVVNADVLKGLFSWSSGPCSIMRYLLSIQLSRDRNAFTSKTTLCAVIQRCSKFLLRCLNSFIRYVSKLKHSIIRAKLCSLNIMLWMAWRITRLIFWAYWMAYTKGIRCLQVKLPD